MAETFKEYLYRYVDSQTEFLKGCLMAAFDSREHYLSLLDESLGSPLPSANIKLCEMLADAGLFREEIKLTRDGRNRYKVFYLTDAGMQMVEQIKGEGFNGKVPQNTPLDSL